MRKLVYGMAVSLDGFMEGPKGETDWMSYDPGRKMTNTSAGLMLFLGDGKRMNGW